VNEGEPPGTLAERRIDYDELNAPEDVMEDPHFIARGFPTRVPHDDFGRDVLYPGAPFLSDASPWRIRSRAPRLGEHDAPVLGPLRASR
jgi:benzylsuccinate CoA-transferase BbsE subunit